MPSLHFSSPLALAALGIAAAACVSDARHRRVSNVLTFGAAVAAVMLRWLLEGPWAALGGVVGWFVGLLLVLPLFALRGLGGGDVKLLAAFGAFVGARLVVWIALYGAIAGGLMAVAVTLSHGVFVRTVANLAVMLHTWRVAGVGRVDGFTLETATSHKLPYAFALSVGLVTALWLKA